MGILQWLGEHWFDFFQTLGVVGGLFFTGYTVRKDERARQISNLIELNDRHDYIWSKCYEQPELSRVLKADADLSEQPISNEENLFTKMLFIHLDTVRRAAEAGLFIELKGLESDIRDFLSLPIPRAVWNTIKPFQDEAFVKFVEDSVNSGS